MNQTRILGTEGLRVSAIGYGAMGLEGYYGAADEGSAREVIRYAIREGCTFIDSADTYGSGHNEQLIGRALAGQHSTAFVATKFGIVFDSKETGTEVPTGWGFSLTINGRPDLHSAPSITASNAWKRSILICGIFTILILMCPLKIQ